MPVKYHANILTGGEEGPNLNKIITAAVIVIVCAVAVAAAAFVLLDGDKKDHHIYDESAAVDLIYDLEGGEYGRFYDSMNDDMRSVSSPDAIRAVWEEQKEGLGSFLSIENVDVKEGEDGTVIDFYCAFENGGIKISIALDGDRLISGTSFEDYDQDLFDKISAGLKEIDVKVNAGGKWELKGKITTAAGPSNTAAVIVHGSGPNDMDGTIGQTKLYKDLAWGLAQNNIDVLRYEKRTYAYGLSSAEDIAKLTVKEETIDDAIAAAELLKSRGYEKVFLIGHSMGGMLAPDIVEESNGLFDGFISLAGSPRTLSEIQADQVMATAAPEDIAQYTLYVKLELAKLDQLSSWSESKVLSETIFGLPAYYVRDMVSRDAGEIALSLDVPMLFLQGSADFQVYADKDFKMWQEILGDKDGADFKLYDGLNHLFMVSQGGQAGTTGEYDLKGHVCLNVIRDIADFING